VFRTSLGVAIGLLVLAASLSAADKKIHKVEGKVKRVDPGKYSITVTEQGGKTVTGVLAQEVKIRYDDGDICPRPPWWWKKPISPPPPPPPQPWWNEHFKEGSLVRMTIVPKGAVEVITEVQLLNVKNPKKQR